MKWSVVFKEMKKHCCPPKTYWSESRIVVVADTIEQAEQQIKKGRIAVEIQKITPIE